MLDKEQSGTIVEVDGCILTFVLTLHVFCGLVYVK